MTVRPRVVVVDYGSGNLRSAERALSRAGAEVSVTGEYDAAVAADGVVVPGVGSFAACMAGLRDVRAPEMIGRRLAGRRPVLGVCVGHQVLFDRGVEHGVDTAGCQEWPGTVERLQADVLPHIGWNTVTAPNESVMFAGVAEERFYFVHSFAVRRWEFHVDDDRMRPPLVSWSEHEQDAFVAAVENGPLWGTQFHPEKSGDAGAAVLRNWVQTL